MADSFLVNADLKIYIWFVYTLSFLVTMVLMRNCSPERKETLSNFYLYSGTV